MTLANKDEQAAFQKFLKEEFPHLEVTGPLSQAGGLGFEMTLKPDEIKQLRERTLSQSLEVLRNRIDQFGVTEPVLVRQGAEQDRGAAARHPGPPAGPGPHRPDGPIGIQAGGRPGPASICPN